MDISENSGFSPQISHFNRVFHYFHHHHPFWGIPIFGNTHVVVKHIALRPADAVVVAVAVAGALAAVAAAVLVPVVFWWHLIRVKDEWREEVILKNLV